MILPPIDVTGADIVRLPVGYKKPLDASPYLVPPPHSKCQHWRGPFEIDVKGDQCKCLACGETVGAMFVLEQLMKQESRWMQTMARYQDEMKRLSERSRTKCQHCGQLTRISGK